MARETVKALVKALREDVWRREHPFAPDLRATSEILTHPYASSPEKESAISDWLQRYQPCVFGRAAAATGRMHYCILSDQDLPESDRHITDKIQAERALWKQPAVRAASKAPHGFLLLVAAPRILHAVADENLRRLS